MAAKKTVRPVTHLLTDWRHIACRKSEQRGSLYADRDPSKVTCPKCRKFAPHAFSSFSGGGANMVPALSYYAVRGGGGAAAAKVKSGRELLDAAIGRIESKSIRAWATSPHNAPIWLKIAEGSFKKNGGGEDNILRLSTYMVLTAMG
jgi:hypothetical protein